MILIFVFLYDFITFIIIQLLLANHQQLFNRYAMEPDDEYMEEIEEFLRKFESGKLKPYLKSQPVPKKQSGPVKVLVANNFDKEVLAGTKDVLVEFYAPW